jgi:hypothetical protein
MSEKLRSRKRNLSPRRLSLAVTGGLATVALVACGKESSLAQTRTTETSSTPAAATTTTATSAKAAPKILRKGAVEATPANPNPEHVEWGQRITLTLESCGLYSPLNPRPAVQMGGNLYPSVDARDSYPHDCNPESDSGAAMYLGASYKSGLARPEIPFVKDGTIGKFVAARIGEYACNHTDSDGSNLWIGIQLPGNATTMFANSVNFEGFGSDAQLQQAGIVPTVDEKYAGMITGGCHPPQ